MRFSRRSAKEDWASIFPAKTLINVVFLPLNLIASIGGMSEFSMMTGGTPWWVSYPLFLTAMMVGVGGMVVGLKRLAK